jgi:hypothetical protein
MAERKKLLLRLDPDVYEAVARWAADDLRSVNAQIEYALRLALRSAGRSRREPPPANAAPLPDAAPPDPDAPRPDAARPPEAQPAGEREGLP